MDFEYTVEINLPDPSGSSPAENPRELLIILDSLIFLQNSLTDSSISFDERFLKWNIAIQHPDFQSSFVSYSQFVPGNTGINTLTCDFLFTVYYFINTI